MTTTISVHQLERSVQLFEAYRVQAVGIACTVFVLLDRAQSSCNFVTLTMVVIRGTAGRNSLCLVADGLPRLCCQEFKCVCACLHACEHEGGLKGRISALVWMLMPVSLFPLLAFSAAKPLHHHGKECLKLRVDVIAADGEFTYISDERRIAGDRPKQEI